MSRRLLIALAAAAFAAAGCGDDDEEKAGTSERPARTQTQETTTQAAGDLTDTSKKPEIAKPTGAPPKKLESEDIVEGKGPAAKDGDRVTVQYVGVSFSTGAEFDASWDGGQPFPFTLGGGEVIPGWDQGVAGMRKGGRRRLVIPPDLAYGAQGAPPDIGPNETLVFVIDLVSID